MKVHVWPYTNKSRYGSETAARGQTVVNRCCSLKSVRHKNQHLGDIEVDRWYLQSSHTTMMWLKEETTAVLLGKGLINTAAYRGWKENIDCEHGESRGKQGDTRSRRQDKDKYCFLCSCTQTWKGQPKPRSATVARVDLQNHRNKAKRAGRFLECHTQSSPATGNETRLLLLCVCLALNLPARRWARHRFNYAVIECDSLITKGKMWGLISTPRAVASARDDRTNRYLE